MSNIHAWPVGTELHPLRTDLVIMVSISQLLAVVLLENGKGTSRTGRSRLTCLLNELGLIVQCSST